jgi:hypothetical protein
MDTDSKLDMALDGASAPVPAVPLGSAPEGRVRRAQTLGAAVGSRAAGAATTARSHTGVAEVVAMRGRRGDAYLLATCRGAWHGKTSKTT